MSLGSVSDTLFFLRDAGEAVAYNGTTSYGLLESMDGVEGTDSGGMVQVKMTTLLVASDVFTNLRHDGVLTVNGVSYRVDRFGPEDDGRLTRIVLAKR